MSVVATPAPAATARPDDGATSRRGVTTISDHVVEKLAVRLATEVPGVLDRPAGGLRGALPGARSTSTSADVEVGVGTARLRLHLDIAYPAPACQIVEQVRAHVRAGLLRLTGLSTTRLDVTVHHLVGERPNPPGVI